MKTRTVRSVALATTLIAGVLGASTTALAHGHGQGKGRHGAHFFEKIDTNGDGKIQKVEAQKVAEERFKKADTNDDGVITKAEARKVAQAMREKHGKKMREHMRRMFKRADKNNNGRIERSESRLPKSKFDKLDANKDEALTPGELKAAAEKWKKKHRGGEKIFSHLDRNGDGKITRLEAEAAHRARFDKMDDNGDGVVSRAEVRKMKARIDKHGHKGR